MPPSAASPCDDGLSAHSDVALSHRQFGVCFIVRAHTLLQRKWRHLPSCPEYNHSAAPDTKARYMARKSTVLHQINFSSTLKNAPKITRPLILDFPSPHPLYLDVAGWLACSDDPKSHTDGSLHCDQDEGEESDKIKGYKTGQQPIHVNA